MKTLEEIAAKWDRWALGESEFRDVEGGEAILGALRELQVGHEKELARRLDAHTKDVNDVTDALIALRSRFDREEALLREARGLLREARDHLTSAFGIIADMDDSDEDDLSVESDFILEVDHFLAQPAAGEAKPEHECDSGVDPATGEPACLDGEVCSVMDPVPCSYCGGRTEFIGKGLYRCLATMCGAPNPEPRRFSDLVKAVGDLPTGQLATSESGPQRVEHAYEEGPVAKGGPRCGKILYSDGRTTVTCGLPPSRHK